MTKLPTRRGVDQKSQRLAHLERLAECYEGVGIDALRALNKLYDGSCNWGYIGYDEKKKPTVAKNKLDGIKSARHSGQRMILQAMSETLGHGTDNPMYPGLTESANNDRALSVVRDLIEYHDSETD